jgi:hypothetical protein
MLQNSKIHNASNSRANKEPTTADTLPIAWVKTRAWTPETAGLITEETCNSMDTSNIMNYGSNRRANNIRNTCISMAASNSEEKTMAAMVKIYSENLHDFSRKH